MYSALEKYDPQIFELLRQEQARQSGCIRLIPSENYVSRAVMIAPGHERGADGPDSRIHQQGCGKS